MWSLATRSPRWTSVSTGSDLSAAGAAVLAVAMIPVMYGSCYPDRAKRETRQKVARVELNANQWPNISFQATLRIKPRKSPELRRSLMQQG